MSKAQGIAQSANQSQFKNRIINGNMAIDQRNAGASVAANDGYTLDRWAMYHNSGSGSKGNVQQNQGSVTPPAGFSNYIGFTTTSAYSVGSTDGYAFQQRIEGYNIADFGWGTASAATVTISFWVRSSLTGTFGGALRNSAGNRSYPFTYTISSANTWEQKSITIAGDTTGTWATNNTAGIYVSFSIGAGSGISGTAGSWAAANYLSATGATSVVGTSGATFYITGVQLEKGTVATSFDYRPYGAELQLCQRYFSSSFPIGTAPAGGLSTYIQTSSSVAILNSLYLSYIAHPVQMRATPTITFYNTSSNTTNAGQWTWFSSGSWNTVSAGGTVLNQNHPVGFEVTVTTGGGTTLNASYTVNGNYTASAEL